jgi:hypothetical protein
MAVVPLLALTVCAPLTPAAAWNDAGHQVVALIAWEHVSPAIRRDVVAALRQATPDSGLPGLFAEDRRPLEVREREFFRRAATWPDRIRDEPALHQPTWHHRDFYWKWDRDRVVDLPDLHVNRENLLERLAHFTRRLADPGIAAPDRAVDIAWVLHLVGDVHQPLHCSARVTAEEPQGDRGGNDFKLALRPPPNPDRLRQSLHAYWDEAIDIAFRRQAGETVTAYLERAARLIMARHPRALLTRDLAPGAIDAWARESLREAQAAYPPTLLRHRAPPASYRAMVVDVARRRIALAGYRLALVLEESSRQRR